MKTDTEAIDTMVAAWNDNDLSTDNLLKVWTNILESVRGKQMVP